LCYVSWNYAVQVLGPVKTSAYIYLVPVVTIIFSALILAETITLVAGLGMALILLGIALSEREKAS
jgi:drug/metabolite transporter (DMT)-like permease